MKSTGRAGGGEGEGDQGREAKSPNRIKSHEWKERSQDEGSGVLEGDRETGQPTRKEDIRL